MSNPIYLRLGRRLRDLRIANALTQRSVAEALGCSRENVYQLESGKYSVRLRYIPALARLYGIAPEEVLRGIFDGLAS